MRTYISALRGVLAEDNIDVPENCFMLNSLTRACHLKNDSLIIRLPIHKDLLHLILKNLRVFYATQPYLSTMYSALYLSAYYGLLQIGELTTGPHTLLVNGVFMGSNKKKPLYTLITSKTHNKGDKPQKIKIASNPTNRENTTSFANGVTCPFEMVQTYIKIRPRAKDEQEQFFVFSDNSPVTLEQARRLRRDMISKLNIDTHNYNFHSLRIWQCGDLLKMGVSVETIKKIGRWKSNAVFAYFKD